MRHHKIRRSGAASPAFAAPQALDQQRGAAANRALGRTGCSSSTQQRRSPDSVFTWIRNPSTGSRIQQVDLRNLYRSGMKTPIVESFGRVSVVPSRYVIVI